MSNKMNKIKGGLSDNLTLGQIAKKHSKKENYDQVLSDLKKELSKGIKVEMEHTGDKSKASEIAMDHLYEDPKYYSKLKKIETNEMTGADASGSFSGPISSGPIKKIDTIHNLSESLDQTLDYKDLFGKKYKYVYGSGYEQSIEPNTYEWIKGRLKQMMRHYLFDFDFYYNWLQDDSLKKEYWRGFDKFTDNMFYDDVEDISSLTLSKLFVLDRDKGEVRWNVRESTSKLKKKAIIYGKIFSKELRSEYTKYLRGNKEGDMNEVTDASSSGTYDVPFNTKGKNPLKIDGVKSIKNSRAVKDKKFPKWGGPKSVFIKVKEKCKKFPYCNQGINAIELLEMEELNESIKETSNKYGISVKEMENLVLNEIKKIFI